MGEVEIFDGRTRLTFADPLGRGDVADYLTVRVEGPDLSASRQVYAAWSEGFAHLARYFDSLVESWQGWPGERVFESVEGDLRLSATHDGHVRMTVLLQESDKPRGWRVSAELQIQPRGAALVDSPGRLRTRAGPLALPASSRRCPRNQVAPARSLEHRSQGRTC